MFVETFTDHLPVLDHTVEFLPSIVDIANFFSTCKVLSRAYLLPPTTEPTTTNGTNEAKETEKINITVSMPKGDELHFKTKMDTAFKTVFLSVAHHLKVDLDSMRFEFLGNAITGDQTPFEVGMKDGEEIDCFYQKYKSATTQFGKSIPVEKMIRSTILLRKLFKRNLASGLKSFGLPEDAFLAALSEDSAQLSGGFALQVITGQFCDKSDIDLYYGHPMSSSGLAMERVLTSHGFEEHLGSDEEYDFMMSKAFGPPLDSRVFYKEGSQHTKTIQLISQIKGSLFAPQPLTTPDEQSQHISVPDYLSRFDFTVCCVAFRVSEDGELHWLIPYAKDIVLMKLEATPFLSTLDLSGSNCSSKLAKSKLKRTITRVLKYNLRGYKPTPKLREMCGLSTEEDISDSVASLQL